MWTQFSIIFYAQQIKSCLAWYSKCRYYNWIICLQKIGTYWWLGVWIPHINRPCLRWENQGFLYSKMVSAQYQPPKSIVNGSFVHWIRIYLQFLPTSLLSTLQIPLPDKYFASLSRSDSIADRVGFLITYIYVMEVNLAVITITPDSCDPKKWITSHWKLSFIAKPLIAC